MLQALTLDVAKVVVVTVLLSFAAMEWRTGRFAPGASRQHTWVDLLSTLLVPGAILTTVLFTSEALFSAVFPAWVGALAGLPLWAMFAVLLVGDDMVQYSWHRLTHSVPMLYSLHRCHHSAEYLSIRVVYRNNVFYYLIMPSIWLSGALLALGLWPVYPLYVVCKMTVIIAAHSSVPWDAPLYRWAASRRVMWVVERVISTPATHSAHHGRHATDGVTHYKGNYGNFLFLWDVLFGTALITRRRPTEFGLEKIEGWPPLREFLWPIPPQT